MNVVEKSGRGNATGASLIDLMVATLLGSLLLASVYTVLFQTQATIESQQEMVELRQQARVAVNQMTIELRMAGYDLGNLTESFVQADTDQIVFVADIDAGSVEIPCGAAFEGAADGGAERIDYQVVAGWLVRTVDCWDGATWTNEYTNQRLAANVLSEEALFQYFDAAGNELVVGAGGLTAAQRALVRSIVITLVLENPDSQALGIETTRYRLQKRLGVRNSGG